MNLLAIDTSSTACSVGLQINNNIKLLHENVPLQQAQKILPMINQLLQEADLSLHQLDALAFGRGPGSFTGVRIATSVMQGIGFGLDLPLIPVSSLAALAQAAYLDLHWKKLIVAIDARIQEMYWGMYQINEDGFAELLGEEQVTAPQKMLVSSNQEWYGVGNAWQIYKENLLVKPIQYDATRLPMAKGILKLAKLKYEKKEWVNPTAALPTYLRNDVAKKSCL